MRRLAIALVGAMLVAGCGSSATPSPAASGTPASSPTDLLAPTDAPIGTASTTPAPSDIPTETAAPTPKPAGSKTYTIKKGDTLYGIAKHYGITVEALQEANPGLDAKHLKIGAKITIPPKQ
jgi:LysM repeat protein